MITANMTPFGIVVTETTNLQMMSPAGGVVVTADPAEGQGFPAYFAVPTTVALVGIRP